MLKKTIIAGLVAGAFAPAIAFAQAAPASEHTLTGNIGLYSQYVFRGLTQTDKQPALQGGFDYSHSSGFYAGTWMSNISWLRDFGTYANGASLEMDFYGGFKFPLGKDITGDVGVLYYYYPGAFYNGFAPNKPKYDNLEVYFGGVAGPFSAKVYVAVSDFFGLDETTGGKSSSGSYYIDVAYATEIAPKLTLGAHVGYQNVRNYSDLSYVDYKLGLTYDWTGWMLTAAIVGTNADKNLYFAVNGAGKVEQIGKSGLVLSISKAF